MKALLVKHLSVTNTCGSRLKLIVEGFKPIVKGRDYELEINEQALQMMKEFCSSNVEGKVTWTLRGFGTLPNGDYVGTLETV